MAPLAKARLAVTAPERESLSGILIVGRLVAPSVGGSLPLKVLAWMAAAGRAARFLSGRRQAGPGREVGIVLLVGSSRCQPPVVLLPVVGRSDSRTLERGEQWGGGEEAGDQERNSPGAASSTPLPNESRHEDRQQRESGRDPGNRVDAGQPLGPYWARRERGSKEHDTGEQRGCPHNRQRLRTARQSERAQAAPGKHDGQSQRDDQVGQEYESTGPTCIRPRRAQEPETCDGGGTGGNTSSDAPARYLRWLQDRGSRRMKPGDTEATRPSGGATPLHGAPVPVRQQRSGGMEQGECRRTGRSRLQRLV